MSALSVFKYKSYRNYTLGRFVLLCGQWLHRMAIGWLVWDITASTVWLGTFAVIEATIVLFITPVAGVIADRFRPLAILSSLQSLYFVFAVLLAVLVIGDQITLGLLIPIFGAMSAIPAATQPVGMSIVSRLVPEGDDLAKAVGLNSVTLHGSRFFGPAIGGVVGAAFGMKFLFAAALIPALFFVIILYFVKLEYGGLPRKSTQSMMRQIRAGAEYAIAHPGIGPLLGLGLCNAFFLMSYIELLPGISDIFFDAGAAGLASLLSAAGLGGLVGSIVITARGRVSGLANWVFISTSLTAFAHIIVATSQTLTTGMLSVFVMSALAVTTGTANQIMIQLSVAPEYRGRIMSLMTLSVRIAPAVGGFIIGALAPVIGMRYALAAFGVLALCVCGWLSRARKQVVNEVELFSS